MAAYEADTVPFARIARPGPVPVLLQSDSLPGGLNAIAYGSVILIRRPAPAAAKRQAVRAVMAAWRRARYQSWLPAVTAVAHLTRVRLPSMTLRGVAVSEPPRPRPPAPTDEELATRKVYSAQTASLHTQGALHKLNETCDKAGVALTEYQRWAVLWTAQTAPEVAYEFADIIRQAALGRRGGGS